MTRLVITSLVIGIVSSCSGPAATPSPATTAAATARPTPFPTAALPTVPPFGLAGNGVIALAKQGDIVVADRPGGDLRPLVAGPEDDHSPMFSPDGTKLAFTRVDWGLMVADADGTNVVQLVPEHFGGNLWSFAPDGRSLVGVQDATKRVVIRPIDPAAALTVLDIQFHGDLQDVFETGGPRFRPTNAQEILVVGQLDADGPRGIYVYDVATGGIRTVVEPDQYIFDVAWFPDGGHIMYGLVAGIGSDRASGSPRVVAADGSGDQAFDALRGPFGPFSNDGSKIVILSQREGEADRRPVVISTSGDGEPVKLACGGTTDIQCPPFLNRPLWIWSPDDSMLIAIDHHGTSGPRLTAIYLQADPETGEMTELDWRDVGTPAWQRVVP